jgi:uncharacterized protein (DUF1697 family)
MTCYVALLRGVNVGGKTVSMDDLRLSVARATGAPGVRSYIQSGNVLFESDETVGRLSEALELAIAEDLGLNVRVIVRSHEDLVGVITRDPFVERSVPQHRKLVMFLGSVPEPARVQGLEGKDVAPDEICVRGREAYLYCPEGYGRSKLANTAVERWLSVSGTTRNWRTVLKLVELSGSLS